MNLTANGFKQVANEVLRNNPNRVDREQQKDFVSFFGTHPIVAAELWNRLDPVHQINPSSKPKHLLWGLLFLTKYNDEKTNCQVVGIKDKNTFRYWSWLFIDALAEYSKVFICFNDRFIGWNQRSTCLISIDATDCPIMEPWPFDSKWYSQKLNGPGWKYELGLSINRDIIVWVNGPFPAGESDLTIFRNGLMTRLADDEGGECDQLYQGELQLKNPRVHQGSRFKAQKAGVRARQENSFCRFKKFGVLHKTFIHNRKKHGNCFMAVAVVVQMGFDLGIGSLKKSQYDLEYS